MSINATEKPLGKIFTSDYRFVIPSFQRAYTWQTENIAQLVTDLQDACHNPGTPYFLGSLILVRDGQTKYQVIDGQQRLISLSIIISVLRELEDDPELIESLNDLIVETKETNYAASKPSHASNSANATPTSSACTCRKAIWRDCSICATTTSNRTRNATSPSTPDKCSTNSRKCPPKTAAHLPHTSSTKSPSSS